MVRNGGCKKSAHQLSRVRGASWLLIKSGRRVAAAATTAVEEEDGDYGYIARVADTVEGDCEREWPVARKNSRTGWSKDQGPNLGIESVLKVVACTRLGGREGSSRQ